LDDAATPRPEGFKEDVAVAERSGRYKEEMYRNLRAVPRAELISVRDGLMIKKIL
jgi:neutral trehalase